MSKSVLFADADVGWREAKERRIVGDLQHAKIERCSNEITGAA